MVRCPICNQELETENQKHECNVSTNPIDEYISSQAIEVQPMLSEVRNALLLALPHAQERISWHMPT